MPSGGMGCGVAQLVARQAVEVTVPGSIPAPYMLGLVAESCNPATGGTRIWDVDDLSVITTRLDSGLRGLHCGIL